MSNRSHFLIALAVAALNACATSEAADAEPEILSEKSQKTLDRFELTGDTRTCVPTRRIRSIKALSDDLLLVRAGTNSYYLNTPTTTCGKATRHSSALTYRIDGVPSLCAGEIITVVSNRSGAVGTVLGGCTLGEFREVQEKAAE